MDWSGADSTRLARQVAPRRVGLRPVCHNSRFFWIGGDAAGDGGFRLGDILCVQCLIFLGGAVKC
jgi:hypothetical protein